MTHIRNRNDLMAWLEENAPYPRIRRAMQEGTAENLGMFNKLGERQVWYRAVKVTSKYGVSWVVGVFPTARKTICCIIGQVYWESWTGDKSSGELDLGDNPETYKELKENAKTKEQ